MMNSNLLCVFLLFAFNVGVRGDRKVTSELNPGCVLSDCKDKIILLHVKAEGKDDTLHHLWDFTGKPSLLLALTSKNATLSVAWSEFSLGTKGAVTFNPAPYYIYGMVVDKIIDFNDEGDTGSLVENATVTLLDTMNFNWKVESLRNDSGYAILNVKATEYLESKTKFHGTVRIKVSAFGGEEHGETLPHLLHSGNASEFDLSLDGVSTQYKNSRFGLRLITVSSDSVNNTVPEVTSRKTMDDEHAPGVFTIVEMQTPAAKEGGCGGYLQWRPVVYNSETRELTNSTETVQYRATAPADPLTLLAHTLVFSLLDYKLSDMLVVSTDVTFGSSGDGFYHKNQYAAWTTLVGYGHPPEEKFSMLVTLVLLIGLGVPAVLIVTGAVCIVLRRLQRNKDDLFLSR